MHNLNIVVVLFFVSIYVCHSVRLSQSTSALIAGFRGGKNIRNSKKSIGKSNPKKVKILDEDEEFDEDDDDEEEDEIPVRQANKKKSRSIVPVRSARKKASFFPTSFIPWKTSSKKKGKGPTIRDRLEQVAKIGQHAYKDIYRRAKVLKSSTFEGNLLKATWPGDAPVPPELLSEIIKYSIPAFKYTRSDSEDDPYVMTMHKLWMKMNEKDWRTITKSLYILHCISRDSSLEACERFADTIKDMSKTRNPKKTDQRYFDLRLVSEVDATGKPFEDFLKEYGKYVLTRAKQFSNKFDELQSLNHQSSEKQMVATLTKAKQLLQLGVKITIDKQQLNAITGDVMKLVVKDLRELWSMYLHKLSLLISNTTSSDIMSDTSSDIASDTPSTSSDTPPHRHKTNQVSNQVSEDSIRALIQFGQVFGHTLQQYIDTLRTLYHPLHIKIIPTSNTGSSSTSGGKKRGRGKSSKGVAVEAVEGVVTEFATVISPTNIQEKYKPLLTLQGGASSTSSSSSSSTVEDDEEEEEQDEQEEEEIANTEEEETQEEADEGDEEDEEENESEEEDNEEEEENEDKEEAESEDEEEEVEEEDDEAVGEDEAEEEDEPMDEGEEEEGEEDDEEEEEED